MSEQAPINNRTDQSDKVLDALPTTIEGLYLCHCEGDALEIMAALGLIDLEVAHDDLYDNGMSLAEILPWEFDVCVPLESQDHIDEIAEIVSRDPYPPRPSYVSAVLKTEKYQQDHPDDRTIRVPSPSYTPTLMDLPSSLTLKRVDDTLLVEVHGISIDGKQTTTVLARDLTDLNDGGGWSIHETVDPEQGEAPHAAARQEYKITEELHYVFRRATAEAKRANQQNQD